jgi:hypothetical protein
MRKYIRLWRAKRPHPKQARFNDKGEFIGYRHKFNFMDRMTAIARTVDDSGKVYLRMRNGQLMRTEEVAAPSIVAEIRAQRRAQREGNLQSVSSTPKPSLAKKLFNAARSRLFKAKAIR